MICYTVLYYNLLHCDIIGSYSMLYYIIYQWSIDYSKRKFKVHGDFYTLSQCFVWITILVFNQLAEFWVAYFRVVCFPANLGQRVPSICLASSSRIVLKHAITVREARWDSDCANIGHIYIYIYIYIHMCTCIYIYIYIYIHIHIVFMRCVYLWWYRTCRRSGPNQ